MLFVSKKDSHISCFLNKQVVWIDQAKFAADLFKRNSA